jgi:hypothetical protein
MSRYIKSVVLELIAPFFAVINVGCTANAPSDDVCTRTCGNKVISGGKISVMPLNTDINLKCTPGTPLTGTYTARYLIYEDRNSSTTSSSKTSDSASAKAERESPKRIPKGSMPFFPAVLGITQDGYPGVSTSSSEFCTDTCGIARIDVRPICYEGELSVGIVVPGLTGEVGEKSETPIKPLKITMSKPDDP